MKKIFTVFVGFILVSTAYSNPIVPPPKLLFSELYFEGDEWIMELVVGDLYEGETLDSVVMQTSAGEAYFKHGIHVNYQDTILITKDSLLSPLAIDKTGDYINMVEYSDGYIQWSWEYYYGEDFISFGDYPGSMCSMPYPGQSLVLLYFSKSYPDGYVNYYWIVKENNPSLGTNAFQCSSTDTISGFIYDQYYTPVKNSILQSCSFYEHLAASGDIIIANTLGEFENVLMYAKKYNAQIIIGDSVLTNVTFSVELDSVNEFTFVIDNYTYSSIQPTIGRGMHINHYPNPVTNTTSFYLDLSGISFRTGIIKIFNTRGQIVDILPVPFLKKSEIIWQPDFSRMDGGVYVYQLELDGREIASNKMLIIE